MSRIAAALAAGLLLETTTPTQIGWVQRSPATSPSARGFFAAAYDAARGVTVIFGGWNGSPLGDTWEWNGNDWTLRQPATSPSARCCYALAYDLARQRVVLFGGTDGSPSDWNDTWEWDGTNWLQRTPANSPSPRRQARMAFDPALGQIVLFGGGLTGSGTPVYGDTWAWDGNDWTQLSPATQPSARWSHGLCHDLRAGGLVLYGGSPGGVSPMGDTWLWDGNDWTLRQPATSPAPVTRQQMAYDTRHGLTVMLESQSTGGSRPTWLWNTRDWTRDGRPGPSARAEFAVAYDLLRQRTVVFGGFTVRSPYSSDTWEYDSGGVASWEPRGAGCAGTAGTPSLAPRPGSRPVVGTQFVLELTLGAGNGPAAISFGYSESVWGTVPLPFDLGALGMPGCLLRASPDLTVGVPVSGGRGALTLSIPNDPRLIGFGFFNQGFAVDPGANALGVVVSNSGAGVIGAL